MMDEHAQKRQWLDIYLARLRDGVIEPKKDSFRYTGPCCGYPTLQVRGGFDICCLWKSQRSRKRDNFRSDIFKGQESDYAPITLPTMRFHRLLECDCICAAASLTCSTKSRNPSSTAKERSAPNLASMSPRKGDGQVRGY